LHCNITDSWPQTEGRVDLCCTATMT
jgi:hypothetical protein